MESWTTPQTGITDNLVGFPMSKILLLLVNLSSCLYCMVIVTGTTSLIVDMQLI